mmetsp:Transcript_10515/g.14607  ORF Transcript_10515/g.14607 Transcript_10515/m.14607 type:complete len:613 (-) Transcript_10515:106-1944(-)|eukprot:CAMPEP_0184490988 /NCGR_PEP_ID=MMETSP0113_2-20130426/19359_1 /TAXON_ID=91329 /ORGANISM="Norrisiella sphaerica, Strain BC52" /LENGTH=612 /DNA_ID=CAMNT_0026875151 /DNA_START=124 /DNA_END=1962 /DNA_ORIENTATION=-
MSESREQGAETNELKGGSKFICLENPSRKGSYEPLSRNDAKATDRLLRKRRHVYDPDTDAVDPAPEYSNMVVDRQMFNIFALDCDGWTVSQAYIAALLAGHDDKFFVFESLFHAHADSEGVLRAEKLPEFLEALNSDQCEFGRAREPLPSVAGIFVTFLLSPFLMFATDQRLLDYLLPSFWLKSKDKRIQGPRFGSASQHRKRVAIFLPCFGSVCYSLVALAIYNAFIDADSLSDQVTSQVQTSTCRSGVSMFETLSGVFAVAFSLLGLSFHAQIDYADRGERMQSHRMESTPRDCLPCGYLASRIMKVKRENKYSPLWWLILATSRALAILIVLSPFIYRYQSENYSTFGVCLHSKSPLADGVVVAQALLSLCINGYILFRAPKLILDYLAIYPEHFSQIFQMHAMAQQDFKHLPVWIPTISLSNKSSILRWSATKDFIVDLGRVGLWHMEINVSCAVVYLILTAAALFLEIHGKLGLAPQERGMFRLYSGYIVLLASPSLLFIMSLMHGIHQLEIKTRTGFKAACHNLQMQEISYGVQDVQKTRCRDARLALKAILDRMEDPELHRPFRLLGLPMNSRVFVVAGTSILATFVAWLRESIMDLIAATMALG